MTDVKAKKLEQIRALLAKADSTDFPAEAEACREKADALMTSYAIDQWTVNAAQDAVGERPKPEVRHVDFAWWRTSSRSDDLWSLFINVADHCRCVVAVRGYGSGGDWTKIPVIGLSSDLDYFDMLFTHLMLQMAKKLEPTPSADKSAGENVFMLRQAGMSWERIVEKMFNIFQVVPTDRQLAKYQIEPPADFQAVPHGLRKEMKNKLANVNRKYVAANDLQEQRNYVNPEVYQRSFALGFVSEVNMRLRQMRRNAEDTGATGSVALAVRDIKQVALDLYNEMYPPEARVRGRGRSVAVRQKKIDGGAYNTGTHEGRKANISNKPGDRLRQTKELR